MADLKYIGKNILNHDLILKKGDVSGSNASTGSFGNLNISKNASITGNMVVGGTLTAQEIHTEIESASIIFTSGSTKFGDTQDDTHVFTGSLKVTGSVTALNLTADSSSFSTRVTDLKSDSGSFSTRVTDLKSDSGSFSTRVTNLKTDSGSFSTRVTKNEGTGSKILNGQLEFTNITASGNISGSLTSTGSFGRIEVAKDIEVTAHKIKSTQVGTMGLGTLSPVGRGLTIYPDGAPSGTSLGNVYGLGISHNGSSAGYYGLHIVTGVGSVLCVQNTGNIGIGNTNNSYKLDVSGTGRFTDTLTTAAITTTGITSTGNISGSSTSTGSFGLVLQNGSELSTFQGAAGTETFFSGSAVSTGSFGRVEVTSGKVLGDSTGGVTTPFSVIGGTGTSAGGLQFGAYDALFGGIWPTNVTPAASNYALVAKGSRTVLNSTTDIGLYKDDATVLLFANSTGVAIGGDSTNPTKKLDVIGTGRFTGDLTLGGNLVGDDATIISGINTITSTNYGGNISGSATSTGSFGRLDIVDNVSATSFTGIFQGALSGSAQIASNISGAFAVASASFAADILSNSSSFSTRITADSSSFAARDTLSEATSSKILNGELEFTNITGSGHISMSLSSTGSFGRVSVTTLGGHSPIVIDGETTFINSITSSAHVSSSMTSTASFGRVNVVALGGHQSLTIDPITTFTNVITASSAVQFDGKIFIETGSIEGDLHVRTNENLMRIGKSTSGVIVSGSDTISRFATGSDGSIIDLGFTAIDEDGNVVLAGDGDGIHVDDNNYWYNNKFYKIGDGVDKFLEFDNIDMKYKGQVFASTGSFDGEMFINSPTGSMFIGKFTGGIPTSGSDTVSRFATGSDGSIIDLGFTTTNEEGETVFLSTGDGIVVDSTNYWYTTGHFKLGDSQKQIEWDNTSLNISASTVDVTTLKASDVNFAGLPTSDPLVTGSLWVSGSATSGSFKSGYVMISGIHG